VVAGVPAPGRLECRNASEFGCGAPRASPDEASRAGGGHDEGTDRGIQ
jgi:hypothetical protein